MSTFDFSGFDDEDVVNFSARPDWISGPLIKVKDLKEAVKQQVSFHDRKATILQEGFSCEILSANAGGGWQTGKLRIRVEFVPDVPDIEARVLPPSEHEGGES